MSKLQQLLIPIVVGLPSTIYPPSPISVKLVSGKERSNFYVSINRYDFTKDMPKTPAPNQYEQHGDTEVNKAKNKGF